MIVIRFFINILFSCIILFFSFVRKCTQTIIDNARENGYVETLFGRRRYLPNINSSNSSTKGKLIN